MTEELLENYETNYLNIDLLSIECAIKNEYPIISLFTPLNAKQFRILLNKITSRRRLMNFDFCYFFTLFIDALSCLISNVSIEFGNEYDIRQLLQTVLYTTQRQYALDECDLDKFEHMLNIIKRSEKRMAHGPFSVIMKQITVAFEKKSHSNFMTFENIVQEEKFIQRCNSIDSPTVNKHLNKQKDISTNFTKNNGTAEYIKMSTDQNEMVKNSENMEDKSQSALQSLQSKVFVKTGLEYTNSISAVQIKRNAFEILMRRKR